MSDIPFDSDSEKLQMISILFIVIYLDVLTHGTRNVNNNFTVHVLEMNPSDLNLERNKIQHSEIHEWSPAL